MHVRNVFWCVVLVGLLSGAAWASGEGRGEASTGERPGDAAAKPALKERVLDAYAKLRSYSATVTFRQETKQGRQRGMQSFWFQVAFDRPSGSYRIDHENFLIISDGKKLRLRLLEPGLDANYLEVDRPESLEKLYPAVSDQMGSVIEAYGVRFMPDLAVLLADRPFEMLGATEVKETTVRGTEGQSKPALALTRPEGILTLELDPKTLLIDRAVLEVSPQLMQLKEGEYYRIIYGIESIVNEKLGAKAFAFDEKGRQFASLDDLLSGPAVAGGQGEVDQPAAGGGDGEGGSDAGIVGKEAPQIRLTDLQGQDFDLAQVKEPVVVVSFWFTWLSTGREPLMATQELAKWADQQKLPVRFVTINCGQKADEVRAFVEKHKITLPVLLDEKSSVAVQGFGMISPAGIAVIRDGKVVKMFNEKLAEAELQAALREAAAEAGEKQP